MQLPLRLSLSGNALWVAGVKLLCRFTFLSQVLTPCQELFSLGGKVVAGKNGLLPLEMCWNFPVILAEIGVVSSSSVESGRSEVLAPGAELPVKKPRVPRK